MRDSCDAQGAPGYGNFPSFSEGLSLRASPALTAQVVTLAFPFLFGGTFIEGKIAHDACWKKTLFPFLFGGTFIEGHPLLLSLALDRRYFPSFSEGLSLREPFQTPGAPSTAPISLPFRRDFH